MGKRANPAVVGAFVVGAIVLAVVAVVAFGSGRFFRTTYSYVAFFPGDVNGLNTGAPVKFRGVPIGSVRSVLLNVSDMAPSDEPTEEDFRIPVVIELDPANLAARGGRRDPDPATIKELIDLGLRAQLSMESFVTGLLYVRLDMFPDQPADFLADPTVAFPEIPTVATPLEEMQAKAAHFLAKLGEADIGGMVESLSNTAKGLDNLVNSPKLVETVDSLPETKEKLDVALVELSATLESVRGLSGDFSAKIGPLSDSLEGAATEASAAMKSATATLDTVTGFLAPESPIVFQLARTLNDLSAASRAIRRFAEDLERNPSMLVRGRAPAKDEQ